MHGLINRSIQNFICDTYGEHIWKTTAADAGIAPEDFEPMLLYEDAVTQRMVDSACRLLGRRRADLLEDLGTFLVTDPSRPALRRLLRFGGRNFLCFLYSLDDLDDRLRIPLADLVVPRLALGQVATGVYTLEVAPGLPGFGHVLVGLLRAMADDFGALINPHCHEVASGRATLRIELHENRFAEARRFTLAAAQ